MVGAASMHCDRHLNVGVDQPLDSAGVRRRVTDRPCVPHRAAKCAMEFRQEAEEGVEALAHDIIPIWPMGLVFIHSSPAQSEKIASHTIVEGAGSNNSIAVAPSLVGWRLPGLPG